VNNGKLANNGNNNVKQIEEKLEENRNYKDLLINIMSVGNEKEMEEESKIFIKKTQKKHLFFYKKISI